MTSSQQKGGSATIEGTGESFCLGVPASFWGLPGAFVGVFKNRTLGTGTGALKWFFWRAWRSSSVGKNAAVISDAPKPRGASFDFEGLGLSIVVCSNLIVLDELRER